NPGVAAVGGPVHVVGVIVRESSASFVHAGDIHVTVGQVDGGLDIADEWTRGSQLSLGPSDTVVTREADLEVPSSSEVVPGNVHIAEEWRGWIIVDRARFSIVT